jgi:hypothetical protein
MTQALANTPAPPLAWSQALQAKLMAALDAAWAILEHSDDPAEIRRVRDKAKAVGDLAAMARKVALIVPMARAAKASAPAPAWEIPAEAALSPIVTQAEHAIRALEKLKGGRRGRM